MFKKSIDKEEMLIRSGNILNSLGVLRASTIHNNLLYKKKFIELVERNYGHTIGTIPDKLLEEVEDIWIESIDFFIRMDILINGNDLFIEIKRLSERV